MKSAVPVLIALECVIAGPLSAKEKYHEVVNAQTEEAFSQLAENVRKKMADGGRYEFVKPDERDKVEKGSAGIAALFRQKGSVDKMSETEKVELFNNQEVVNAILTRRDSPVMSTKSAEIRTAARRPSTSSCAMRRTVVRYVVTVRIHRMNCFA